jgi:hypothetical protein
MESLVCGGFGESLFDQRLIPLGFARSFACWTRSGDRESGVNELNRDISTVVEEGTSVCVKGTLRLTLTDHRREKHAP